MKLTEEQKKERKRASDRKWREANRERERRRAREWRKANPKKHAANQRKHKYGITQEQHDALLEAQDFRCAMCLSDVPKGRGSWHVDHCHATGRVRGLLCQPCNMALGLLNDNPDTLLRAVAYLKAA